MNYLVARRRTIIAGLGTSIVLCLFVLCLFVLFIVGYPAIAHSVYAKSHLETTPSCEYPTESNAFSIDKTSNVSRVEPGDSLSFTIKIVASAPVTITNITDELDDNFAAADASIETSSESGEPLSDPEIGSSNVVWLGEAILSAGDQLTLTIAGTVRNPLAQSATEIVNCAIIVPQGETQNYTSNPVNVDIVGILVPRLFLPNVSWAEPPTITTPVVVNGNFEDVAQWSVWTQLRNGEAKRLIYSDTSDILLDETKPLEDPDVIGWLGGRFDENHQLHQTIQIPESWPNAQLVYWQNIMSWETDCSNLDDTVGVRIDTDDVVPAFGLCADNSTPNLWNRIDNILPDEYIGKGDVVLEFWANMDGNNYSNWHIDKVIVCTTDAGQPEVYQCP